MRVLAYVVDAVLFFFIIIFGVLSAVFFVTFVLSLGIIIWWLITLKNGQTPGKQSTGLRAYGTDGKPHFSNAVSRHP